MTLARSYTFALLHRDPHLHHRLSVSAYCVYIYIFVYLSSVLELRELLPNCASQTEQTFRGKSSRTSRVKAGVKLRMRRMKESENKEKKLKK